MIAVDVKTFVAQTSQYTQPLPIVKILCLLYADGNIFQNDT
jgi:hypothetical protein